VGKWGVDKSAKPKNSIFEGILDDRTSGESAKFHELHRFPVQDSSSAGETKFMNPSLV
jgi:hypothetical protein